MRSGLVLRLKRILPARRAAAYRALGVPTRAPRIAAAVAATALLAAPAAAPAAVTCDYSSAGKLLTVSALVADAQLVVMAGRSRSGRVAPPMSPAPG